MLLVSRITGAAAATIPHLKGFKGHWSYGKHLDEQVKLIVCLNECNMSQLGCEVLILGCKDVSCPSLFSAHLTEDKTWGHVYSTGKDTYGTYGTYGKWLL